MLAGALGMGGGGTVDARPRLGGGGIWEARVSGGGGADETVRVDGMGDGVIGPVFVALGGPGGGRIAETGADGRGSGGGGSVDARASVAGGGGGGTEARGSGGGGSVDARASAEGGGGGGMDVRDLGGGGGVTETREGRGGGGALARDETGGGCEPTPSTVSLGAGGLTVSGFFFCRSSNTSKSEPPSLLICCSKRGCVFCATEVHKARRDAPKGNRLSLRFRVPISLWAPEALSGWPGAMGAAAAFSLKPGHTRRSQAGTHIPPSCKKTAMPPKGPASQWAGLLGLRLRVFGCLRCTARGRGQHGQTIGDVERGCGESDLCPSGFDEA